MGSRKKGTAWNHLYFTLCTKTTMPSPKSRYMQWRVMGPQ